MSRPGHLGRIVFGYALSCLPPAVWFGLGNIPLRNYDEPPWQLLIERLLTDIFTAGTIIGACMAIPALGAIWLAERRHWVSPAHYVFFGACAPILVILLISLRSGELKQVRELPVWMAFEFSFLGLISGLTYWAVAGRRAGWSGT